MTIILVKEFEVDSTVMGFHVYRKNWNPKVGDVYNTRMEPENKEDKYAVAVFDKEGRVVGHIPKGKSGKYAKTVFFYLRSNALNLCSVKVTGRAVTFGDFKGMRVPCRLAFGGNGCMINLLKGLLNDL